MIFNLSKILCLYALFLPIQSHALIPYKGTDIYDDGPADIVGGFTMIGMGVLSWILSSLIKKEFYSSHKVLVHVILVSLFILLFIITKSIFNFYLSTGQIVWLIVVALLCLGMLDESFYKN